MRFIGMKVSAIVTMRGKQYHRNEIVPIISKRFFFFVEEHMSVVHVIGYDTAGIKVLGTNCFS